MGYLEYGIGIDVAASGMELQVFEANCVEKFGKRNFLVSGNQMIFTRYGDTG